MLCYVLSTCCQHQTATFCSYFTLQKVVIRGVNRGGKQGLASPNHLLRHLGRQAPRKADGAEQIEPGAELAQAGAGGAAGGAAL